VAATARPAAFHHERRPGLDRGRVGGELHAAKAVVLAKRRVPRLEQRHVGVALHEADVWHRMNEFRRVSRHAACDRMGPELPRVFKLLEDLQRPGDVDAAVGLAARRIAEFTEPGMTGARVVPAVGRLAGEVGSGFDDPDRKPRLQPLEHRRQTCRHDPAPDEQDVARFRHGWDWGLLHRAYKPSGCRRCGLIGRRRPMSGPGDQPHQHTDRETPEIC
jgi:hypothetical protein